MTAFWPELLSVFVSEMRLSARSGEDAMGGEAKLAFGILVLKTRGGALVRMLTKAVGLLLFI